MTAWHRSEYVSIPAAKTRRYLLVLAMTGAFGGVTLAAALPDPPAPANNLASAYNIGSAGSGAIRNIIEEHAKAKAATKAAPAAKVSTASEPSAISTISTVNKSAVTGKPLTIGDGKHAADPLTTGSIGRNGNSFVTVRKTRVAGGDDAIARWLRNNGVLDSSGTSSGRGPVVALNR